MQCPSFERLIDYLDNRLSEAEAAGVATHLTSCAACTAKRDWYQQVSIIAASDDMVAPPPWVLKRASRIFNMERGRSGRLVASVAEALASLIFDSHARPAVADVRSAKPANRQLLYRSGDYTIDLQIAPSEQMSADLIGQVLNEREARLESVSGLKLDFLRDGSIVTSVVTNEMGEFKVKGMAEGVYDLRVELPEGSIVVSGFPLSAS